MLVEPGISRTELLTEESTNYPEPTIDDYAEKTNNEHPRPQDVKALSDLIYQNKGLQLWRDVASAGQLAELTVIENSTAVAGLKECWRHRLQGLKKIWELKAHRCSSNS
jgi:hypothetical protein